MFATKNKETAEDAILGLRGLGREIWAGVDADEYVHRLRKDWQLAHADKELESDAEHSPSAENPRRERSM